MSHKKLLEQNFENPQHGLHSSVIIYQPVKLDGMRLKIEGVLILCIVVVLAKTCFEKFSSGKNSRSPLSRKLLDVLKKNGLEINLMYIYIPPKFQFRYFDQFQRERLHESRMKLQDMI